MGHLLEVKDVTKIYEGGVLANHNVNFTVDEGEIHALVGENGAGKSTLMKMLYGLESITSGHIYMNGEELKLQSGRMPSPTASAWCISILCWWIP